MKINPGKFNKRIEVWQNILTESQTTYCNEVTTHKIKELWASITPKTGSLISGREAGTMLSNTTHQIRCRYDAGKEITPDCWIIFTDGAGNQHRFSIDYILEPFFSKEVIDIYVQEEIG